MKLYTEEQVIDAIKMARIRTNIYTAPSYYSQDEVLERIKPIELPSDDEVEEKCNGLDEYEFDSHESAFFNGAKWIRNKIQGGKQ